MGKKDSLVNGKHCKGCSHRNICDTHGCAALEARRNIAKDIIARAKKAGSVPSIKGSWIVWTPPLPATLLQETLGKGIGDAIVELLNMPNV